MQHGSHFALMQTLVFLHLPSVLALCLEESDDDVRLMTISLDLLVFDWEWVVHATLHFQSMSYYEMRMICVREEPSWYNNWAWVGQEMKW